MSNIETFPVENCNLGIIVRQQPRSSLGFETVRQECPDPWQLYIWRQGDRVFCNGMCPHFTEPVGVTFTVENCRRSMTVRQVRKTGAYADFKSEGEKCSVPWGPYAGRQNDRVLCNAMCAQLDETKGTLVLVTD